MVDHFIVFQKIMPEKPKKEGFPIHRGVARINESHLMEQW